MSSRKIIACFVPAVFALSTLSVKAQTLYQWSAVNGGNNHYYMATSAAMNWSDADALATSKGGYLATIQSQAENDFLQATFFPVAAEAFWIGLHRTALHTQSFVWTNGEPLAFTNWSPGEPNDNLNGVSISTGEPCVAINWYFAHSVSSTRGQWNDTPNGGGTVNNNAFEPYRAIIEFNSSPGTAISVSGTVTLGNCDDPEQAITFEFRPKNGGTPFKRKQMLTQSGANSGTFSLPNIPAGTYDIAIKGFSWLRRVLPNVVVNGDVFGLNATLISADLNNDNSVDVLDFGILVNEYGEQGDL